ncbi:hypothetical protein ACLQ2R_30580 [Streptosporangium sp. DT93]|uniref:hypothetical protein n=1 Tax=Streptosporangium sp. DT93 TaxID=3393428 RepID=UPI003CF23E61
MTYEIMESADSLHGRLQRGLGGAVHQALKESGAGDLVYDCISRDPRGDSMESRGLYYARLVVDLGLPFDPIVTHLFETEATGNGCEPTSLAIDVLMTLVQLGYRRAGEHLHRYVCKGANWEEALGALFFLGDPTLMEGLDEMLLSEIDNDESIPDILGSPDNDAMRAWIQARPRIAQAYENEQAHRRQFRHRPRPSLEHLSDEELYGIATGTGPAVNGALVELGNRGDLRALRLVQQLYSKNPITHSSITTTVIDSLGEKLLPMARAWVAKPNIGMEHGYRILAKHGTLGDAPALVDGVTAIVQNDKWPRSLFALVDALTRLPVLDSLPILGEAWRTTRISSLRRQILEAIHRIDPSSAAPYAEEGLWDCESMTRRLAATLTPLHDVTLERLALLRDDPAEDLDVQDAAAERLDPAIR